MTKRAIILSSLGFLILAAGVGLLIKLFWWDNQGIAALEVHSFPKAEVFLNGQKIGETPVNDQKQKPGDYALKISAVLNGQTFNWESRIKLTSDTVTFINREFSENPQLSAGEVLGLEKLADNRAAEIAVISDPNGAIVKVDGKSAGTTPLTVTDAVPIDHEITLSYPGFRNRSLRGRAVTGYRLNISVDLAKEGGVDLAPLAPTPTPTATPSAVIQKPYVVIKSTPTGWLRVRFGPSISASESGRVNPGDKFPLLEEQTGWVKIRFKETLEGWVSDSYVEKVK
jgi:hypothetical protein